ncbi:MAG: YwmB family TATA-box binding protein [Clostridiales bacterium]|nr:YwmB family TATA-box binding protein [Clostridiales bacterium]
MKKCITAALLLAAMLFCGCRAEPEPALQETGEDAFAAAFLATGAQLEEMRLIAWSLKEARFMTAAELKSEAERIAASLGLQDLNEKKEDESGWRSYSLQGVNGRGNFQVLLQALPGETYIMVSVAAKSGIEDFSNLCRELLEAAGGKKAAELRFLLVGSFPGKLSRDDLAGRFSAAFAAAGAQTVEQAQGSNYFSVTGHLPGVTRHLLSGQKKVNLQMAGDFSETEQKTFIYLGSPLIFDDY